MKTTQNEKTAPTPWKIQKWNSGYKGQVTGITISAGNQNVLAHLTEETPHYLPTDANLNLIIKAVNEYEALTEAETCLEMALEHLEAISQQEDHGDELCDDGNWHTNFCQENGCVQWRIERSKTALANLKSLRS